MEASNSTPEYQQGVLFDTPVLEDPNTRRLVDDYIQVQRDRLTAYETISRYGSVNLRPAAESMAHITRNIIDHAIERGRNE